MVRQLDLNQVAFCASGSNLEYQGSEGGGFVVCMDGAVGFSQAKLRLKIQFTGVAAVRISDSRDSAASQDKPISVVEASNWRDEALSEYVQQFGIQLLAAISNIQHFVVRGQEQTVAVLARRITVSEMQ